MQLIHSLREDITNVSEDVESARKAQKSPSRNQCVSFRDSRYARDISQNWKINSPHAERTGRARKIRKLGASCYRPSLQSFPAAVGQVYNEIRASSSLKVNKSRYLRCKQIVHGITVYVLHKWRIYRKESGTALARKCSTKMHHRRSRFRLNERYWRQWWLRDTQSKRSPLKGTLYPGQSP